jgi:hypothetical protein
MTTKQLERDDDLLSPTGSKSFPECHERLLVTHSRHDVAVLAFIIFVVCVSLSAKKSMLIITGSAEEWP